MRLRKVCNAAMGALTNKTARFHVSIFSGCSTSNGLIWRPAPARLQATLQRGEVHRIPGTHFWLFVRRPGGVHVALGGKPVALPARRNLKVVVTPTRTARAGY